jgi:hypothetical protein
LKKDPFLSKFAGVDGLIGSSVLKHFIWYFDLRNDEILVSDSPYSLPSASSAMSLPFTTDDDNRALVKGTFPNRKNKNFIMDTGEWVYKQQTLSLSGAHPLLEDTFTYQMKVSSIFQHPPSLGMA